MRRVSLVKQFPDIPSASCWHLKLSSVRNSRTMGVHFEINITHPCRRFLHINFVPPWLAATSLQSAKMFVQQNPRIFSDTSLDSSRFEQNETQTWRESKGNEVWNDCQIDKFDAIDSRKCRFDVRQPPRDQVNFIADVISVRSRCLNRDRAINLSALFRTLLSSIRAHSAFNLLSSFAFPADN